MKKLFKTTLFSIFGLLIVACSNANSNAENISEPETSADAPTSSVATPSVNYDDLPSKLENSNGISIEFANRGAKIDSLKYDGTLIGQNGFIAGRCGNRIANATFELNGQTYNLDKNNGQHHLHGGSKGFGEVGWKKIYQTADTITFALNSPDGDMGYPGNMYITVTYKLNNDNELTIEYEATSDADTLINPLNHLYFSLNGYNASTGASNHVLWIDANQYTEKDSGLIPTGALKDVAGTKYDFTTATTITPNSYDDNFVLEGTGFRKVASMYGSRTNIGVDVYTDRPGLQVYNTRAQICLETQNFPDAIHHTNFPSPVLRANERFYSKTMYVFSK